MRDLFIKAIKAIPIIGKWKIYSEKYFTLNAEPGKYNSPIVTWAEVEENQYYDVEGKTDIQGIDLQSIQQKHLLENFAPHIKTFPFEANKSERFRYFYNNPMFGFYDGIILYAFLMHFQPKKIIEIGSGYSSALTLDTYENYLKTKVDFTFIDPYTNRVDELMSKSDLLISNFVRIPVQKVDLKIYNELEEGDVLFIDSSHIVKTAGDLNFIFFEILPRLKKGVFVHVHDIFFPFEYPKEWIQNGFCYNEAYFLRAFLMNNNEYEIVFWNDYMYSSYQLDLEASSDKIKMNRGGSIWLKKK